MDFLFDGIVTTNNFIFKNAVRHSKMIIKAGKNVVIFFFIS